MSPINLYIPMITELSRTVDEFVKLAGGDLQELLRQAITNSSNDTYQVFLDLLEEEKPDMKHRLTSKSIFNSPLRHILIILNMLFPAVVIKKVGSFAFSGLPFGISVYEHTADIEIHHDDVDIQFMGAQTHFEFRRPITLGNRVFHSFYLYKHFGSTLIGIPELFEERLRVMDTEEWEQLKGIIDEPLNRAKKEYDGLLRTFGLESP